MMIERAGRSAILIPNSSARTPLSTPSSCMKTGSRFPDLVLYSPIHQRMHLSSDDFPFMNFHAPYVAPSLNKAEDGGHRRAKSISAMNSRSKTDNISFKRRSSSSCMLGLLSSSPFVNYYRRRDSSGNNNNSINSGSMSSGTSGAISTVDSDLTADKVHGLVSVTSLKVTKISIANTATCHVPVSSLQQHEEPIFSPTNSETESRLSLNIGESSIAVEKTYRSIMAGYASNIDNNSSYINDAYSSVDNNGIPNINRDHSNSLATSDTDSNVIAPNILSSPSFSSSSMSAASSSPLLSSISAPFTSSTILSSPLSSNLFPSSFSPFSSLSSSSLSPSPSSPHLSSIISSSPSPLLSSSVLPSSFPASPLSSYGSKQHIAQTCRDKDSQDLAITRFSNIDQTINMMPYGIVDQLYDKHARTLSVKSHSSIAKDNSNSHSVSIGGNDKCGLISCRKTNTHEESATMFPSLSNQKTSPLRTGIATPETTVVSVSSTPPSSEFDHLTYSTINTLIPQLSSLESPPECRKPFPSTPLSLLDKASSYRFESSPLSPYYDDVLSVLSPFDSAVSALEADLTLRINNAESSTIAESFALSVPSISRSFPSEHELYPADIVHNTVSCQAKEHCEPICEEYLAVNFNSEPGRCVCISKGIDLGYPETNDYKTHMSVVTAPPESSIQSSPCRVFDIEQAASTVDSSVSPIARLKIVNKDELEFEKTDISPDVDLESSQYFIGSYRSSIPTSFRQEELFPSYHEPADSSLYTARRASELSEVGAEDGSQTVPAFECKTYRRYSQSVHSCVNTSPIAAHDKTKNTNANSVDSYTWSFLHFLTDVILPHPNNEYISHKHVPVGLSTLPLATWKGRSSNADPNNIIQHALNCKVQESSHSESASILCYRKKQPNHQRLRHHASKTSVDTKPNGYETNELKEVKFRRYPKRNQKRLAYRNTKSKGFSTLISDMFSNSCQPLVSFAADAFASNYSK